MAGAQGPPQSLHWSLIGYRFLKARERLSLLGFQDKESSRVISFPAFPRQEGYLRKGFGYQRSIILIFPLAFKESSHIHHC